VRRKSRVLLSVVEEQSSAKSRALGGVLFLESGGILSTCCLFCFVSCISVNFRLCLSIVLESCETAFLWSVISEW